MAFQRGAYNAAELSPVHLVTWSEFQQLFQAQWPETHLMPWMMSESEALLQYTETSTPVHRLFSAARPHQKSRFLALRDRYEGFTYSILRFLYHLRRHQVSLPFRSAEDDDPDGAFPIGFFTIASYREWSEATAGFARVAVQEFQEAIGPLPCAHDHEPPHPKDNDQSNTAPHMG